VIARLFRVCSFCGFGEIAPRIGGQFAISRCILRLALLSLRKETTRAPASIGLAITESSGVGPKLRAGKFSRLDLCIACTGASGVPIRCIGTSSVMCILFCLVENCVTNCPPIIG
jgi:hypothetical protein